MIEGVIGLQDCKVSLNQICNIYLNFISWRANLTVFTWVFKIIRPIIYPFTYFHSKCIVRARG